MEYKIRPIVVDDLPELLVLMKDHADYERAFFSPEGKLTRLRDALFQAPERLYCEVVVSNDRVIGYVSYTYDFSTWDAREFMYMDCLFLCEQARNVGIGTSVMNRLKQIALKHACVNIQWQTPNFNESAIRFYDRLRAEKKGKARFIWAL